MDVQINNKGDQGLQIGEHATDKIAAFGAAPVVQPAAAGQAAVTPAVVTAPTALTDNGGGTADNTVSSLAPPTTLTDSTGYSGTKDNTLAATVVPADLTGGESPTEAEHNAVLALLRVMAQNTSDNGQKVIEIVTLLTAIQNNFKELTTAQAANRAAIVSLAAGVSALETLGNAQRTALVNTGWMKGAA